MTNRNSLTLDGTETYDVIGIPAPNSQLELVIHRHADNTASETKTEKIPVLCRLDTEEEVTIYNAGGVLQRFAQDFLEANS